MFVLMKILEKPEPGSLFSSCLQQMISAFYLHVSYCLLYFIEMFWPPKVRSKSDRTTGSTATHCVVSWLSSCTFWRSHNMTLLSLQACSRWYLALYLHVSSCLSHLTLSSTLTCFSHHHSRQCCHASSLWPSWKLQIALDHPCVKPM